MAARFKIGERFVTLDDTEVATLEALRGRRMTIVDRRHQRGMERKGVIESEPFGSGYVSAPSFEGRAFLHALRYSAKR